jgi:hypothetical protein
VISGYWADSYATGEGFTEQDAKASLRNELRLIPTGEVLPPGRYLATVTSSQWTEIPFRLQLSSRKGVLLSGQVDIDLTTATRTSLVRIGGTADIPLSSNGRTAQVLRPAAAADMELTPAATVERISPYVEVLP